MYEWPVTKCGPENWLYFVPLLLPKKNAEALVAATKEIGLLVNAHKTTYMTVSRDQNGGRIHGMKMDNSSIERVEEFKYLGTTLTNQKKWEGVETGWRWLRIGTGGGHL